MNGAKVDRLGVYYVTMILFTPTFFWKNIVKYRK
jgi:hypothetical protein